jgi:putative transposase
MKSPKPRRRYDAQFREHAVKLVLSTGKPVQTIAHELGISHTCLQNWKADYLQRNETSEQRLAAAQMHIERLERELERVTHQRDILKKSLGILSEGPLQKDMPK